MWLSSDKCIVCVVVFWMLVFDMLVKLLFVIGLYLLLVVICEVMYRGVCV